VSKRQIQILFHLQVELEIEGPGAVETGARWRRRGRRVCWGAGSASRRRARRLKASNSTSYLAGSSAMAASRSSVSAITGAAVPMAGSGPAAAVAESKIYRISGTRRSPRDEESATVVDQCSMAQHFRRRQHLRRRPRSPTSPRALRCHAGTGSATAGPRRSGSAPPSMGILKLFRRQRQWRSRKKIQLGRHALTD
jgi:hypothetical protein